MSISVKSLVDSLEAGKFKVFVSTFHDKLVAGPLKFGGSWGGVACRAHVSIPMHIAESSFWMLMCYVAFKLFDLGKKLNDVQTIATIQMSQTRYANTTRILDKLLATVHFSMYLLLIHYKWNFSSLISLIQPCHLVLLFEGIALASDGLLGVMISILILPVLSGTFLAILFPDTTGLEQPYEELMYWVQHYLIIIVPVYLLQRRNGIACNLSTPLTVGMGVWLLGILHFSFYEVIDLLLSVNVEFMLCPTGAMTSIFSLVPSWLIFPTYRSVITLLVFLIGPCISYAYIYAARLVLFLKSSILPQKNSAKKNI